MDYWENVRAVAISNRTEIGADLDRLRADRAALKQHLDEAERRIAAFELLAQLADEIHEDEEHHQGLTLHAAMAEVLKGTDGYGMRAPDLASEINKRGLYRMRNGRPVEAQQIHARVGNYDHLFERRGTFIVLVDDHDLSV